MSVDSVHIDQQGNILAQGIKKLEIKKEMRKSPSSVFSWPAFANISMTKDIMTPLTNLVQVRSTDTVRSVLWTMIKNKVECVPVHNEATRKYIGFVDMFDMVQYIMDAAGSSITRPDFFQVFKRQSFGDAHISKITNSIGKECLVTEISPVGVLFELAVSTSLGHIPVMNKQRVVGFVSQPLLVEYLANNKANFSELAAKTILDLNLSGTDNVYTVEDNATCVTAFGYMVEKGVRGVAVVNKDGQLVDAINSLDVKGLVHGDFFSDLRQPVLRYLSKTRILLGKNLAPVVCSQNETLADVLDKMTQERVNRVFVIDNEKKPISVISLRDILKVLHATPSAPLSIKEEKKEPEPVPEVHRLAPGGAGQ